MVRLAKRFLPVAFSGIALASPLSVLKRDIWTNQTCTGSSLGDTELVPVIPSVLIDYLMSDLQAAVTFEGSENTTSVDHRSFCTSKNDTSVLSIRGGAAVSLDHVDILKYGYSTDLNQASFFGVNAAINVANSSTLEAHHLNITSHNGAAGIYSYGSNTRVNTSHSTFYATGPVSHGAYAGGNGTLNATNWYCETYGFRSSCYSGDSPAGYLTIRDSEAYTYGLGSAVMYTLGISYLHNVKGYAERSPWTFLDGEQEIYVFDSDLEGGNYGACVLFSSQGSGKVATVNVTRSILRAHGDNAAGIAVGGTTAKIALNNVEFAVENGIVLSSNTSSNPQTFDAWISPADQANIGNGVAEVTVTESTFAGDFLAINGSTIDLYLYDYSVWTGKVRLEEIVEQGAVAVYLDGTSAWSLTGDSTLQNFTITGNDLDNIESNGFNIYYNSSQSCNSWIGGGNVTLSGGGSLIPYQ